MALDKDALKKHHFWVLAAAVPAFVLFAAMTVAAGVGGSISQRLAAIDKQTGEVEKKLGPKTQGYLDDLDAQKKDLEQKREQLWKFNWEEQRREFRWPQGAWKKEPGSEPPSPILRDFERRNMEFMTPLSGDERSAITEQLKQKKVYEDAYLALAQSIAPTQFGSGGWPTVLRHVNAWDAKTAQYWQIWQLLEDFWVQRVLIDALRTVNDKMAQFQREPLTDPKAANPKAVIDEKLHRKFKGRVWEVELKVDDRGAKGRVLVGKLKNVSDRMQLLGVGNRMILKVKLDPNTPDADAMDFRIEGEFVAAGATIDVKEIPVAHTVKAGVPVTEIAEVRQQFDTRTVPIRRVDRIEIPHLGARHYEKIVGGPMNPGEGLKFHKKRELGEAELAAAAATPGGPAGEGGPRPAPGGLRPGDTGGVGGGTIEAIVDANKKRYILSTDQVRRLPVGIVLIVEQSYIPDVLVALANTPLRFQTAQTEWQRFRGTLGNLGGPGDAGGTPGGTPDGPVIQAPVFEGGGLRLPGSESPRGIPQPGVPGAEGPGAGPGSPTGSGVVSESQLTAGLVELAVCGAVSLYEKFPDPPKDGEPEKK